MVKKRILTETLPPIRVPEGTTAKIEQKCNGKMQVSEYVRNLILKEIQEEQN